jgi:eukaryotic-like serine/threonine-protein kinase
MNTPKPENWAQLSPLLDELLDLPEPNRLLRLAGLRAANPQLADELAALLTDSQNPRVKDFLAKPLPIPGVPAAEATLAGQRLGPYLLLSPLGQGGTGSVWRARREDGRFTGEVAIKLLHLSLLGRAGADRFKREGDILARLTHPNIAHLLDAGVTPAGQPYLVIELVEGERIDRHCDVNHLTVEARLALFDDVLSAVAHAHTHLVIHRDIKPGNIMVTPDGAVKLLDFGIAKLLEDEAGASEATELTRDGGRVLTPEYAAPEQLRGEAITTATDVYALGVLLYQLLGGRHPTSPTSGTSAEVVRATLETDAQLLSRAVARDLPGTPGATNIAASRNTTVAGLRHLVQGDLENITAHALRKLPGERYATVAALSEDLRRYRGHEPVRAVADTLSYRATKFVRRNRLAVGAASATLLALLAGVVGTTWQAL